MAYDRHDTRNEPRDERSRWRDERSQNRDWDRERGGDDRGFFGRMGDEIGAWFGGEEDDRMRGQDRQGHGRDRDQDWDRDENRGRSARAGYRPITGDYGRSSHADSGQHMPSSGIGRGEEQRPRFERSQSPSGRDEHRQSGWSEPSQQSHDPHYGEWRRRHLDELDRDYDDYRREHQSKFESDFGGWREKRQSKRQMLGQIREQMDVIGNDQNHVGTVDRVAGDRIILTKSDSEAGGAHHSLSCTDIDRVEGDQVILDCSAEQATNRWRDESRGRALFEREDQGSAGPHVLDRSFGGTYR